MKLSGIQGTSMYGDGGSRNKRLGILGNNLKVLTGLFHLIQTLRHKKISIFLETSFKLMNINP